ncbi:MAG: hypothetical protein FWF10_08425 [Clostridiales bacterium]|nr:hypothetical protein [Clostridiales bacterium]
MKRIPSILLAVLLLLCVLPALKAAKADIIFTPTNDFFDRYKEDCILVERYFYFPNADKIVLKTEPGSDTDAEMPSPNGIGSAHINQILINYVYDYNGTPWGYTTRISHYGSFAGWVSLEDALLVYDEIAFAREHRDSFYEYPGGNKAIRDKLQDASTIVVWDFPCSGKALSRTIDNTTQDALPAVFSVLAAYRDEAGREWAHILTHLGYPLWICLSDPKSARIPASFSPPQAWSLAQLVGDCVYDAKFLFREIDRPFSPNGPKGFVSVKENPGSDYETFTIENGTDYFVQSVFYYKGAVWGRIAKQDGKNLYGWVPMDQMRSKDRPAVTNALLPPNYPWQFYDEKYYVPVEEKDNGISLYLPPRQTPDDKSSANKENKPLSPLALAIILVSGAVLGSAVLILIFWRPKRRTKEAQDLHQS